MPRKPAKVQEKKKVLVGVRVPSAFHRRIEAECLKRDLNLQQLLTAALEWYFKTPVEWLHAKISVEYDDPELTEEQATELSAWSTLWDNYLDRMPREKVEAMAAAMKWDLEAFRSSRRKPDWKPLIRGRKG